MNKLLKLEKLKFSYQYLRDIEKDHLIYLLFVLPIVIASFTSTMLTGKLIWSFIGMALLILVVIFFFLDLKKCQKMMGKIKEEIDKIE